MKCKSRGEDFTGPVCSLYGAQVSESKPNHSPTAPPFATYNPPPMLYCQTECPASISFLKMPKMKSVPSCIPKNRIAKVVRFLGWGVLFVGTIGSVFLSIPMAEEYKAIGFIFALFSGVVASMIACFLFLGFAEVIELLQKNIDQNTAMLCWMKRQENTAVPTNVHDAHKEGERRG